MHTSDQVVFRWVEKQEMLTLGANASVRCYAASGLSLSLWLLCRLRLRCMPLMWKISWTALTVWAAEAALVLSQAETRSWLRLVRRLARHDPVGPVNAKCP